MDEETRDGKDVVMDKEDAKLVDDEAEELKAEAVGLRKRLRNLRSKETGQSGSGSQGEA